MEIEKATRAEGSFVVKVTRPSTMAPLLTYWQIWTSARFVAQTRSQTNSCVAVMRPCVYLDRCVHVYAHM